ncbi:MAG: hypothetical protein RR240_11640 [Burkholderiaceae bacterium]
MFFSLLLRASTAATVIALAGLTPALAQDAAERALRAAVCSSATGSFEGAPRLLAGLGDYSLPLAGQSPIVQRWFDQGLVLAWGFNFAAAEASMQEAARLAPDCAMCWWGVAYVPGPSVNHDLSEPERVRAHEAIERAHALALVSWTRASPRERQLIAALRLRHAQPEQTERGPQERAYGLALARLVAAHPRDADLLTLAAEAQMAPRGREYWSRNGAPQPWTPPILSLLERALAVAPQHPGANHLYIHALEDAPPRQVERALTAAQRLARIAPGVGHLVHMPAHVYFRLGRFDEAVRANQAALEADRQQFANGAASLAYETGYGDHNHHFLWAAAMMAGRAQLAQEQALILAAGAARHPRGSADHLRALPIYTAIRFGEWAALLTLTRPQPHSAYTDGVWHVARGLARVRSGALDAAAIELAAVERNLEVTARKQARFKNTHELDVMLRIARDLLAAELAAARGDYASAIASATAAVAAEDGLDFDEPPAWHMPARHSLGAILLAAGRPVEAVAVYRLDLRLHPDNGWSLRGLANAYAQSGDLRAARKAESAFTRVWQSADRSISASRL